MLSFSVVSKPHIIGNLPFNVSVILTHQYLDAIAAGQQAIFADPSLRLTLMYQKEVAEVVSMFIVAHLFRR
jgi:16S rRNA A1518/A1519 N6-dimethyltransferase RsmA/KsgA/DIM1 with predicted DNA glycosylase/AP lyase activity